MTILAVLTATACAAMSDEVTVAGLPYPGVEIVDVKGGQIAFRMPAGNVISKPLAEVAALKVSDAPALNQAEELMQQGKAKEAVNWMHDPLSGKSIRGHQYVTATIRWRGHTIPFGIRLYIKKEDCPDLKRNFWRKMLKRGPAGAPKWGHPSHK